MAVKPKPGTATKAPATRAPAKRAPAKKAAERPAKANTAATRAKTAEAKYTEIQAGIPDIGMFESYVGRSIVDGMTDHQLFDYARTNKLNVLLEGPTGCAKTSAVLAYAAYERRPFYAIPSNVGIEPSQLFGKFVPMPDGSIEWIDGPVTSIVRHGGVLLINEVNFMPDRVATVLFGLLDKRRQITLLDHKAEVIDAHDDLLIVADMNPEYEGTRPLNKAFRNRFPVQVPWGYDEGVEQKLITSGALREMAEKLRSDLESGGIETPCSTNMLIEFEQMTRDISYDFAVFNFVAHFQGDERNAVKLVVETFKNNIIDDLDDKKRKAKEAAERKHKAEQVKRKKLLESMIEPARKNKQRVIVRADPDFEAPDDDPNAEAPIIWVLEDDVWGIEGVDWVYKPDGEDDEYEDDDEVDEDGEDVYYAELPDDDSDVLDEDDS